uniref:Uncharacterized protein n=1 Tax=viral metagenome TaxID=1070528 RepID=A0A6H1ZQP1_9ZZZZ
MKTKIIDLKKQKTLKAIKIVRKEMTEFVPSESYIYVERDGEQFIFSSGYLLDENDT